MLVFTVPGPHKNWRNFWRIPTEEGYRIMIENAEKAYKIAIRKKHGTK